MTDGPKHPNPQSGQALPPERHHHHQGWPQRTLRRAAGMHVHAWYVHGACMVYARCMHGVCMVHAWCMHGACRLSTVRVQVVVEKAERKYGEFTQTFKIPQECTCMHDTCMAHAWYARAVSMARAVCMPCRTCSTPPCVRLRACYTRRGARTCTCKVRHTRKSTRTAYVHARTTYVQRLRA